MHRSLLILIFSALLVVGGCGGGEPSEEEKAKRVRAPGVSEETAIDAAKAAVRARDSFADSADYTVTPLGDSGWQVTATSADGDVRLILVDENGEVVRYDGG